MFGPMRRRKSWLEKDMGSVAYRAARAKVLDRRRYMIKNEPEEYVQQVLSRAQGYMQNRNYLAASGDLWLLVRDAKRHNLPVSKDLKNRLGEAQIKYALARYEEYLQTGEDVCLSLAKTNASEAGLFFFQLKRMYRKNQR